MSKKTKNSLSVLSMFCGCGGLDLGFEEAGFDCIWANDSNKDACQTYKANFEGNLLHEGNIEDIEPPTKETIKDLTVLLGGFPCQAFSNAGQRKGIDDHRGQLYKFCMEYIDRLQPKFVVFENVRGLLTIAGKEKHLLDEILEELEGLGYIPHVKLVEASNYGVPQRRIRVFIVAHRKDLNLTYRFPKTKVVEGLNLGNILKIPKKTPNQDQVIRLNPQAHILGDMVPEGGSWKSIPYDSLPDRLKRIRDDMRKYRWPNFYRRFSREEIAGTITAAFKPENAGVWHPTIKRPFSVREIARIQSFPDTFIFEGSSIKSLYQMIGNAVPPKLAEAVATSILSSLEEKTIKTPTRDYLSVRESGTPIRPEADELIFNPEDQTHQQSLKCI
jgi:DNA (cytosine-5)-methyltransferase 1